MIMCLSCDDNAHNLDFSVWQIGWRMVNNSWNEDYATAATQFDSLLRIQHADSLDVEFVITGLIAKHETRDTTGITSVFKSVRESTLYELCNLPMYNIPSCQRIDNKGYNSVTHRELNMNVDTLLRKIYYIDQLVRGNTSVLDDPDIDVNIKKDSIMQLSIRSTDEHNREKLKNIIENLGKYPTKDIVTEKAMRAVFLVVLHADREPKWQAEQLSIFDSLARSGDLDRSDYAYLYDRVMVNSGKPQLYGTQFKHVNAEEKLAVLHPVKDEENLDKRRMSMGLMPISLYKYLMLKDSSP